MKFVIITHLGTQITITSDTVALLYEKGKDKPMLEMYMAETLFFIAPHKTTIAYIGNATVEGIFVENILNDFAKHSTNDKAPFSIKELQSAFHQYMKKNWPEILDSIFKEAQFIFIRIDQGTVEVDRLRYEIEEGYLQRSNTQIIRVEQGEQLVVESERAYTVNTIQQPSAIVAQKLNFQRTRLPMSEITFSHDCRLLQWHKPYIEHGFQHLEDFLSAVRHGHIGSEIFPPYTRNDLKKLAASHEKKLDSKPGFKRFFTYEEFIKITRNRDFNDISFYTELYKFINQVTEHDDVFRLKLKTVINNGVLFIVEKSNVRRGVLAYFEPRSNILFLNVDSLGKYPFSMRARVFRHEVEHAFQKAIHQTRWLDSSIYDDFQLVRANNHFHGLPYFPYSEEEENKFCNLVAKGVDRLKKIMSLLHNGEEAWSKEQKQFVAYYRETVAHYIPKINLEEETFPLGEEVEAGRGGTKSRGSIKTGFTVIKTILVSQNAASTTMEVLTRINDPLLGLPFDILTQLDTHGKDPCEVQARIVGELPIDCLALLFPELLEYAQKDFSAAFGDADPLYTPHLKFKPAKIDKLLYTDSPDAPNPVPTISASEDRGDKPETILLPGIRFLHKTDNGTQYEVDRNFARILASSSDSELLNDLIRSIGASVQVTYKKDAQNENQFTGNIILSAKHNSSTNFLPNIYNQFACLLSTQKKLQLLCQASNFNSLRLEALAAGQLRVFTTSSKDPQSQESHGKGKSLSRN